MRITQIQTAKRVILTLAALILCSVTPTQAQMVTTVGVPSHAVVLAKQSKNQWCWAACIQSILKMYGINKSQESIVRQSYGMDPYGNLPNFAGSFQTISANLNQWIAVDDYGQRYSVAASMSPPNYVPRTLVTELSQQRPVILAYMSGPNSGHAVLCTAVDYYNSPYGPVVTRIRVRDPFPGPDIKDYRGSAIGQLITTAWSIRAVRR